MPRAVVCCDFKQQEGLDVSIHFMQLSGWFERANIATPSPRKNGLLLIFECNFPWNSSIAGRVVSCYITQFPFSPSCLYNKTMHSLLMRGRWGASFCQQIFRLTIIKNSPSLSFFFACVHICKLIPLAINKILNVFVVVFLFFSRNSYCWSQPVHPFSRMSFPVLCHPLDIPPLFSSLWSDQSNVGWCKGLIRHVCCLSLGIRLPGPSHINLSAHNWNILKIYVAVILISLTHSGPNFAHVTTAELS